MKARITCEGLQRIERYFVTLTALREALANALCHRDYMRGVPLQIKVCEDRLHISNSDRFAGVSLDKGDRWDD